LRRVVPTLISLLVTSAVVVGCGDDSEEEEHEAATPAVALREVGETRAALQAALATYKAGDAKAAEEEVAEAYLQHFEEVEGALEERDHELNEELEEAISMELREKIKTGSTADVQKLTDEIDHHLTTAEGKLK
jgi:hypothetical protein